MICLTSHNISSRIKLYTQFSSVNELKKLKFWLNKQLLLFGWHSVNCPAKNINCLYISFRLSRIILSDINSSICVLLLLCGGRSILNESLLSFVILFPREICTVNWFWDLLFWFGLISSTGELFDPFFFFVNVLERILFFLQIFLFVFPQFVWFSWH